MKYKLIENSANDINDIIGTVLRNRGVEKPQEYLNCTKHFTADDWRLLDNIDKAVEVYGYETCYYDGVHPSPVPCKIIAEEWLKVFKKEVLKED